MTWISLTLKRVDHRGEREPSQEAFHIIQKRDNNALGQEGSGDRIRAEWPLGMAQRYLQALVVTLGIEGQPLSALGPDSGTPWASHQLPRLASLSKLA